MAALAVVQRPEPPGRVRRPSRDPPDDHWCAEPRHCSASRRWHHQLPCHRQSHTYFLELFGKWRLRRALSTARGPWPPWTTPRRARTTASSTESYHIAHIDEKGFWVCCDMRPRRPRSAPTHTPHPAATPKNLFLHPEPRSQPHIMSWAAWHQTLHNLRSTHLIHAHEFINSTK